VKRFVRRVARAAVAIKRTGPRSSADSAHMPSPANSQGTVELGDCAVLTRNAHVDRLEEWGTRNFRYKFKAERNRIYAVSTLRQKVRATIGALRFIWL